MNTDMSQPVSGNTVSLRNFIRDDNLNLPLNNVNNSVEHTYRGISNKYRKACRLAFNERVRTLFHKLNFLYSINDGRKFWNIIRKNRKANNDPSSDIALSSLVEYYNKKFSMGTVKSNTILNAEQFVVRDSKNFYM